MTEVGARKAISYHDRVKTAGAFAALTSAIPSVHTGKPIPGFHVNGTMTVKERDAVLKGFRHAPEGIATNVSCLAEGIDVPEVDFVAFMAAHRNPIDIAQMCGRVLRLSPETGKEYGYIFVPVYLDLAAPENATAGAEFADALDAIHAMAALDDAVAEALIQSQGPDGTPRNTETLMSKIRLYAPPEILQRLRAAIEVRVFSRHGVGELHDARWNETFQELKDYHCEHGHIDLANITTLGAWLKRQRVKAQQGTLRADRLQRLMELGFVPNRDVYSEAWESGFREYRQFWLENGHGQVPQGYVTKSGYHLGQWLGAQRDKVRKKKLTADRLARLAAIGFVAAPFLIDWEQGRCELEKFRAENGHVDVPYQYVVPGGFRLWQWVHVQRSVYRKGKLKRDRLAKLLALGVEMNPLANEWERAFGVTAALVRDQGHAKFQRDFATADGVRPWVFIQEQRKQFTRGTLPPERLARLTAAGIPMNALDDKWERKLRALEHHVQETGDDPNVSQGVIAADGTQIGAWLNTQRDRFRQGLLSESRLSRLEAIGVFLDFKARDRRTSACPASARSIARSETPSISRSIIARLEASACFPPQHNPVHGDVHPSRQARRYATCCTVFPEQIGWHTGVIPRKG
jgi:hypothetical protein